MSNFVSMGQANRLDHDDFNSLAGTDYIAKLIKNRLVLNYEVSIPNPTVNSVETFVENNVKGIWYSRVTRNAVIFYFEHESERAYVASMIIRMINQ